MSQLLLFQGVGSSQRHLILDIHGDFYNPSVDSINVSTGQVKKFQIEWKETDVFLGAIESSFDLTQVKAIVIRAMEYDVMTFKQSYAFRLKCKEFCEKHGIFYFVGNDIHLNALAAIVKTHTMVKEGEEVCIVMSKLMDLVFTVKLIREHGHYRYIGSGMVFTPMQLQIIFSDYKPKKVIILHNTEASEEAKNEINEFLKEYNPILLHQGLNYELEKEAIIEKVFHLTGERKSVYDVGVSCSQAWFDVRLDKKCLINIVPNEVLPLERTITINVDHAKTIGLFAKFEVPYERLEEVKLSDFKTKKVKITLKIDINLLYEFTVDPVGPIIQPPSSSPKVRVVFYPKHFSVYLQNKNKESILEDFDDTKKIPLCISFNEKKPIIGNPALKLYSTKPKFVVFDLIELSCISNIESADSKYKFKLDKEDETIMITVETFEGERRSSVQFLLALILKHALLLVKNEIGKKMEEMEIEFDSVSENEILKKNFEDAGKLINVKVVFD